MQSCALPSRLHAAIFPFLVPGRLMPCLLFHVCDGVIGAHETVGSIRLLARSSLVLNVCGPRGIWQQGAREVGNQGDGIPQGNEASEVVAVRTQLHHVSESSV